MATSKPATFVGNVEGGNLVGLQQRRVVEHGVHEIVDLAAAAHDGLTDVDRRESDHAADRMNVLHLGLKTIANAEPAVLICRKSRSVRTSCRIRGRKQV